MRRPAVAALLCLLIPAAASADSVVIAQIGDAYVSRDADADSWTLGASSIAFTVGLASGTLHALELRSARLAAPVDLVPGPETVLLVNGRSVTLGADDFDTFRIAERPDGVVLDLVFTIRTEEVRVTRSYAAY